MAYKRRFRRTYRRSYRGAGIAMNAGFLAGAALSFAPISLPPQVGPIVTALAVAPIRLPGQFNQLKMAAQGYAFGKVIQAFVGNPLAGTPASGTGSIPTF